MNKVIVFTNPKTGLTAVVMPAYKSMLPEETLDKFLERVKESAVPPDATDVKTLDVADLPGYDPEKGTVDRTFRDAWKVDGAGVMVDLDKAKELHMDRIRKVRDKELEKTDKEFVIALSSNNTEALAVVNARKKLLRNIPQVFHLNTDSVNVLKEMWPDELPRE